MGESNRKQITSILENRSQLSYSEAESINEEARKLRQSCAYCRFEDETQQYRPRTSRDEDDRSRHGNDMGEIDRDARGKL